MEGLLTTWNQLVTASLEQRREVGDYLLPFFIRIDNSSFQNYGGRIADTREDSSGVPVIEEFLRIFGWDLLIYSAGEKTAVHHENVTGYVA